MKLANHDGRAVLVLDDAIADVARRRPTAGSGPTR